MKKSLFLMLCVFFHSTTLFADNLYEFIERKQAQKRSSRWTLAGYQEMKERNALMDQWLALHTAPNIFDFQISMEASSFSRTTNDVESSEEFALRRGIFAFHFNIFGLEAQYTDVADEYRARTGIFHFRILGTSQQSTFIALQYGVHLLSDKTYGKYNYEFSAVWANFYFTSFFGAEGGYRHYYKTNNDAHDTKSDGRRVDAGVFLEAGWIRIYATWFKETMFFYSDTLDEKQIEQGTIYGLRLYF